ncbi:hypothetical protein AVEN_217963-1 [Araneus ventricosus]|uniref:Uncharacterized protein n=1 Tax=Araneus ventricosus TaxID=182803 RepID=A0A4Y2DIS4_ARAVE|nr:hypothetical protein AVEN_217963-1 [Araneus ventricosus]
MGWRSRRSITRAYTPTSSPLAARACKKEPLATQRVIGRSGSFDSSSARPSPRVRSPTENHEPGQDCQRGSSSPAPYTRTDSLE